MPPMAQLTLSAVMSEAPLGDVVTLQSVLHQEVQHREVQHQGYSTKFSPAHASTLRKPDATPPPKEARLSLSCAATLRAQG